MRPVAGASANPRKTRTGLDRVWQAGVYSMQGLRAGWNETAFRQEAIAAVAMVPLGCWLGQSWVERSLLAGTVLMVLIVELLNTCVEAAIDRVGTQWHELSKRAKDLGSAAVFLSLLACAGTWAGALWNRLFP
jgi:diacylglycerol kinase (ATP)